MGGSKVLARWIESLLQRHWWRDRPSALSVALLPVSLLYRALAALLKAQPSASNSVPVLVVGNVTVGGAGKTPTVIALARAFQAAGRRPGVISRGFGRDSSDVRPVAATDDPKAVGDEPLLIRRCTGVPVWVGRNRVAAARELCLAEPAVDVIISDDGLQHAALCRQAELLVFDARGVGNGWLLPAGPLRQALPMQLTVNQRVLYTAGVQSTALPGRLAQRSISHAWPLGDWQLGKGNGSVPLAALRGRTLLAAAGVADPEKFFEMLESAGLTILRLPLPDHFDWGTLPWPVGTREVVTTEKDAVKLARLNLGAVQVWVLPLDFELPTGLVDDLLSLLPAHSRQPPP
jgi:tetraacyldisaccharide 4'-kinase